jgi:alginate O-acetyltransferase complex protein AlgI
MAFSSPSFLFVFLPAFFLVYFAIPAWLRNAWLLIGSLAFYFSGASTAFYVLVLSIPVNHYLAQFIAAAEDDRMRRVALVIGVILNLAPLVLYKYLAFFVHVANDASALAGTPFGLDVPAFLLPAGISFFTFQALSYLADAYTRTIRPARRMIDFGMYHTSFPQLIAGPIVRYVEIADAVESRTLSLASVQWGVVLFCIGLSKKIIIGDHMGSIADRIFALPRDELVPSVAWLGTLTYTLQIYFDFSGYSDMAIGLGHMLGFKFPQNFDQPYRSQSMTEFWRRWHMTLSRWFRDYVYVPLGGNRRGPRRTYVNLVIVFALCGLWHGAAYTFLIWGLFHGAILIAERVLKQIGGIELSGLVGWSVTIFLVMIGWVFFRSDSLAHALGHLEAMFAFQRTAVSPLNVWTFLTPNQIVFLIAGVFFALAPLRLPDWATSSPLRQGLVSAGSLACFAYSLTLIAANGFNPFIYFRF